jgi:lipoprotein-anchoring transpeptidase ErfK/SrfK
MNQNNFESITPNQEVSTIQKPKAFDTKKFLSFVSAAIFATNINGGGIEAKTLNGNNREISHDLLSLKSESKLDPTQAMASLIAEAKNNKEILNQVSLKLDLSERTLTVSKGGESVITYPIATGAKKLPGSNKDWSTPTGKYKIEFKTVNPDRKDPRISKKSCVINGPTGCYFMNFKTEYTAESNTIDMFGIHGTFKNDSIGKAASHGCIRMFNKDVQNLFQIVQVGTDVEIVE